MTEPVFTAPAAFLARRRALHAGLSGPALLAAGEPASRNYPANRYGFLAASHFLYFVGRPMAGSALLFEGGRTTLFTHPPDPEDALWHGPRPNLEVLAAEHGFDAVLPLAELDAVLGPIRATVATLPTQDAPSAAWLSERVGRPVLARTGAHLVDSRDAALADAMIALRLTHDAAAVDQLRMAARMSAEAHVAGMRATRPEGRESDVHAAMLAVLRRHGLDDAYGPIVTVHGEVLHSDTHANVMRAGDLLLEAQYAAIAVATPGRRYRDVHEMAKRTIVGGLVALGIFRGDVDGLLERGAAALFFPHGIGHLLGLDVHDMEDLGDRAGYAAGRTRTTRFGDRYLRLDRDLEAGMAVTIEPGFYQVPGILGDARLTAPLGADLCRDVLAQYADVRGIRIEDDVLITSDGNEVMTSGVPKLATEIEALMRG